MRPVVGLATTKHRMLRLTTGWGILLTTACATTPDAVELAENMESHTGHAPSLEVQPEDPPAVPPGVRVDDGLTEDEAVAIAVWNSPRVRTEFTRLAVVQGNLADARRPSNPTLRFLFPSGPQQLSVLVTWPLENLVLRRRRIEIARAELDVVAQGAVQTAVDLVRDTRLAHIEWRLAVDRLAVQQVVARQADELAVIAEARAVAGEVAPRDGDIARIDARVAVDNTARAEADVAIAEATLRNRMRWLDTDPGLHPAPTDEPRPPGLGGHALEELALQSRPDLRATQLSIESAGARLGLQRTAVLKFAGVGSVIGQSVTGGPQAELPIFDQNQGGIKRATAELEAAKWRYHDMRAQIVAEVTRARLQLDQALTSLAQYRDTIVTARERDVETLERNYRLGEIDYTEVLLAAQRLEGARFREVELTADARRARAELERALGGRMAILTTESR